jgi:hypothetical protein
MTDEVFEHALEAPNPVEALIELVRERFELGDSREIVLEAFERKRQALRDSGRERDEDAIMDVMDFLVGWCSPHQELKPSSGARSGQQDGTA